MKKPVAVLVAVLLITSSLSSFNISADQVSAENSFSTKVNIDLSAEKTNISPYIYGINDGCDPDKVTATAIRQGGNRYTAYNWETNYSNAGSDWSHSSDTYLSSSTTPGQCSLNLADKAKKYGAEYTLATLQMAGYVSADIKGTVSESETAPGSRWNKVEFKKNGALSNTPDLTDGTVYMDEYVNYLVNKLGASDNGGIRGYSLDNEPALWSSTHPRVHPEKLGCDELIERSVELSKSVKEIDKNAEVFGPALYGFGAYNSLQSAPDWDNAKKNKYGWYLSYYLEKMAEAEKENGTRLLDVLDLHYYSEAKGIDRVTVCKDNTHTDCIQARMQAPRTLWDDTYTEDSWIGQWYKSYLPIIPKVKDSIDKYYPGTKLAFTEYNFGGGNHISGAIAQADALGIFGQQGVYLATLWPIDDSEYMYSGINLYTNYDGKGSSFGDISVPAETDNLELCTAYASINSENDNNVYCVLTNKSLTESESAEITITGSSANYNTATVYAVTQESSEIKVIDVQNNISGNKLTVELPPLSVAQVVISDNHEDEPEAPVIYYQMRDEDCIRFIAEVSIEDVTAAETATEEIIVTKFDDPDTEISAFGTKSIYRAYKALYADGQLITAPEGKCYLISTSVANLEPGDTVNFEFTLDGVPFSRLVEIA